MRTSLRFKNFSFISLTTNEYFPHQSYKTECVIVCTYKTSFHKSGSKIQTYINVDQTIIKFVMWFITQYKAGLFNAYQLCNLDKYSVSVIHIICMYVCSMGIFYDEYFV